jgi:hypothetical protein
MRARVARHTRVPLLVDVAIALALVAAVTFYIVVTEYRVGNGELTRAELLLLDSKTHVAHAHLIRNGKTTKQETQGEETWPMVELN